MSRKCISSVLVEREAGGLIENALKLQSKGSGNAGQAQNSLVSRMYSLTYFHVGAPPNEGNPSLRSCIIPCTVAPYFSLRVQVRRGPRPAPRRAPGALNLAGRSARVPISRRPPGAKKKVPSSTSARDKVGIKDKGATCTRGGVLVIMLC